jgi:DNA-binding LytR/AlgR family response regulator
MREEVKMQQKNVQCANRGGCHFGMKIAICDNNPSVLNEIKDLINEIEESAAIDTYSEIQQFFDAMDDDVEYDVIFMDIEWDDEANGIDYASAIKDSYSNVVFITAYPQKYVEKIFNGRIDPIGFLKKPIDKDQLARLITKVKVKYLKDSNCLIYQRNGRHHSVEIKDINYFEGNLHKMVICMTDGQRIDVCQSLGKVKDTLPRKFIEIHKSYIINPDHVDEFSTSKVRMKNGIEIPVSRSKSRIAKATFMEYAAANI